jgi:molybdopterin converting factor small subunit
MCLVHIPAELRTLVPLTQLELPAESVAELVQAMDSRFPGVSGRLLQDGELRPGLAVVINGAAASLGVLASLQPQDEVHFLPAIAGG